MNAFKAKLESAMGSAEVLVYANTVSIGGDVLFAFLWNAQLVLRAPALGLTLLGVSSFAGAALGLLLIPRVARIPNQARFLAFGTAIRTLAVASVIPAAQLGEAWTLSLAVLAQLIDVVVGVLTAGAVPTLIAERVKKDRFVQVMALSQSISRVAVLSAWLAGGALLSYLGVIGLLLFDVASFLPITFLLFYWARSSVGIKLVEDERNPKGEHLTSSPLNLRIFVLAFGLIVILGSLVSRTTPLLWQTMFGQEKVISLPLDITLGLLFAVFTAGFFLGAIIATTPWGSQWITQRVKGWGFAILVSAGMGIALASLPLLGNRPLVLLVGLVFAGIVSGLLYPVFIGKARQSFEALELRQVFYYMGLVGRFGEPLGSGVAGIFLIFLNIKGLYFVSGIGIVIVAIALLLLTNRKPVLSSPNQP